MFCVYCGTKNPPEARFCFSCGKPMQTLAASAGQQSSVSSQSQTTVSNQAANAPSNSPSDPFGLGDILLPFSYQPSNTTNQPNISTPTTINASPTNKPLDVPPPQFSGPNPTVNISTDISPTPLVNPASNVFSNPVLTQPNSTTNFPANTPPIQPVMPFSNQTIANSAPPVTPLNNPSFGGPNYYQPPQQPNYPPMPFPSQQPNGYYSGNVNNPYTRVPVATYNPYTGPTTPEKLSQLHPLLKGAIGLPYEFYLHPDEWYSFVSTENKVSFVKLAGLGQRISAMLIDVFILLIFNAILLLALGISMAPQIGNNGTRTAPVDVPIWYWIMAYAVNLGYLGIGTKLGHTLGKRAVHIQIRLLDGSKLSWFLAFLRSFSGYLLSASAGVISFIVIDLFTAIVSSSNTSGASSLVFLGLLVLLGGSSIGYLWPLWDKQKQTWHDKLVRSIVTDDVIWVEGINFGLPPRQPARPQSIFTPTSATSFNPSQNPFAQ